MRCPRPARSDERHHAWVDHPEPGYAGDLCGVSAGVASPTHRIQPGFSPLRDPVSLYAAGRYRALYALALVAAGVCALGMAGAFILIRAPLPGVGLTGLVALGLARLLLVTVPARLSDRDVAPGDPPAAAC